MFRLLVVDDEYYMRLGIKTAIDWSDIDVEIVGEARDGEEALEMALLHRPELILTDIRMPSMDGLELMGQVRSQMPECGFIILSGYSEFEYARQAIQQGALAYLLKPIDRGQLKDTVRLAIERLQADKKAKEYYRILSSEYSEMQQRFLQDLLHGNLPFPQDLPSSLSDRELPVVTAPYTVTVVSRNIGASPMAEQQECGREWENLQKNLSSFAPTHLLVRISSFKWCAVTSLDENGAGGIQRLVNWWRDIAEILQGETGDSYAVGISSVYGDLDQIPLAYQEAQHAADVKGLTVLNSVTLYQSVFMGCESKEVRDAMKYIKNNFYKEITVESAAGSLGISASRLMHVFKENLGLTFNTCVMESRISAVIRLMETKKYRVYEIAQMVGYSDVKYFSKVFKEATGKTPGLYMKDMK